MDLSLLITLIVIFVATLVASVLSSLNRDRCLVDFDGYRVVVERLNGRPVYGGLSLSSTGFELAYEAAALDEQLHREGSYIFYSAEYAGILGVYRFVDELTADKRDEREQSWMRAFQGSWWTKFRRRVSNFIGTATDSLTNALNLVVGKTTAKAQEEQLLLAQGETEIKGLTKQMLGYVGKKYDPLLEGLVGELVVLQVKRGDISEEYVGVLKDYSIDFVELLDCYVPEEISVHVDRDGNVQREAVIASPCTIGAGNHWLGGLEISVEDGQVRIANKGDRPVILRSLIVDKENHDITAMLDARKAATLEMPSERGAVTLHLCVMLRYDIIFPRRMALIRHRAERYSSRFLKGHPVVGLSMTYSEQAEADLRKRLATSPDDSQSALVLAMNLIANKEIREAERWLREALAGREKLVDNGLYAELLQEYVCCDIERTAQFTEMPCQVLPSELVKE